MIGDTKLNFQRLEIVIEKRLGLETNLFIP